MSRSNQRPHPATDVTKPAPQKSLIPQYAPNPHLERTIPKDKSTKIDDPKLITRKINIYIENYEYQRLYNYLLVQRSRLDFIHLSTLFNKIANNTERTPLYNKLMDLCFEILLPLIPTCNAQSISNLLAALPKLGIDLHKHLAIILALLNTASGKVIDFKLLEMVNLLNALTKLGINLFPHAKLINQLLARIETISDEVNGLDLPNIFNFLTKLNKEIILEKSSLIEKLTKRAEILLKNRNTGKAPKIMTLDKQGLINTVNSIGIICFIFQNLPGQPAALKELERVLILFLNTCRSLNPNSFQHSEYTQFHSVLSAINFKVLNLPLLGKMGMSLAPAEDMKEAEHRIPAQKSLFRELTKYNYKMQQNSLQYFGAHLVFPEEKAALIINTPAHYFGDHLIPKEQFTEALLRKAGLRVLRVADIAANPHALKSDWEKLMAHLMSCLDETDPDQQNAAVKSLNEFCFRANQRLATTIETVSSATAKTESGVDEKSLIAMPANPPSSTAGNSDRKDDIQTLTVSVSLKFFPAAAPVETIVDKVVRATAWMESGDAVEAKKAYDVFSSPEAKDDGIAIHNLGVMFATGQHVPKDLKQAKDLFKRAMELGDPGAHFSYEQACLMLGESAPPPLKRGFSCP